MMEQAPKPELSQKEYLKRYLSKDKGEKKKKKIKISSSSHLKRSVIIDDDLGLPNVASVEDEEFNLDYLGDEAPQIAGIIDERPPEIKAKESHGDKNKWKPVGDADENDIILKSVADVIKKDQFITNGNSKIDKKTYLELEKFNNKKRNDSDSDLSPPRKSQHGTKTKRKGSDTDFPPARKYETERGRKRRESDSDLSPPRKSKYERKEKRHRSDSDLSPTRKNKYDKEEKREVKEADHSRKKKYKKEVKRKGSDSDQSPHHKKIHKNKARSRKGSDFDLSPPRKSKYIREAKRKGSDSDLSPPRRSRFGKEGKRKGSDSEHFSHRTSRNGRESKRNESDSDLSPPRKNKHKTIEKSMDKTLDGKKAGLQDAKNLKAELKMLKEQENAMFEKMQSSISGKTAKAVMRDRKTGKIRDLEKEKEDAMKKSAKVSEMEKKYERWGKGLKQAEEMEDRIADYLHEINKPLARYAGDDDLERILKAREREGDPMLDYIKSKQSESVDLDNIGKPTYRGYYLPNRFNIRPGHRWDGVDRSNGYEKQWFERQNAKKALQEEAYKWSTSDM